LVPTKKDTVEAKPNKILRKIDTLNTSNDSLINAPGILKGKSFDFNNYWKKRSTFTHPNLAEMNKYYTRKSVMSNKTPTRTNGNIIEENSQDSDDTFKMHN
jgi:hypothetical protein